MVDNGADQNIWSTRWTFVMAATGSAVGLGNIWKFPYIAGEYGGGAFVLVYLVCIALIGIPVMMAEVMLGRTGRSDPIDVMHNLSEEFGVSRFWTVVGISGVLAGILIMSFYSVVAGWALEFIWQSASGLYDRETEVIQNYFGEFFANKPHQLFWHSVFTLLTAVIVGAGVTRGIGRAVDTLMPCLFVLMVVLVGYAATRGDFDAALNFMFHSDFSKITGEAVMVALGHAFFTLSLGMGAIMVYGSYMPTRANIGRTVIVIAALDTLIALMAGMAIFPIVFSNGLQPSAGPGLMFSTLPLAFQGLPGGAVFGAIFFVLVSIAALSSSISLLEPGVSWLNKRGLSRALSVALLAGLCWIGGVFATFHSHIFDFLDNLTAKIMLPLGGLLIAVFVGWVMPKRRAEDEMQFAGKHLHTLWYVVLRFVAPLGIAAVFIHELVAWIAG